MRQLIFAWAFVCLIYFVWRYLPSRPKFFVLRFIEAHAFWVIAIFVALIGVLFWQGATSTKLF